MGTMQCNLTKNILLKDMVDLEDLAKQITAKGDEVKDLKAAAGASSVDPAKIKECVAKLLELKQAYADANGGIGVDGKPFEKPLTKAEKKKKEKEAKKAKAAAEAAAATSNNTEEDAEAAKKKKEAKKAATKAARAAFKAGKVDPSTTSKQQKEGGTTTKAQSASVVLAKKKAMAAAAVSNLCPLEFMFNPNKTCDLSDPNVPIVALAVAVLCNRGPDLSLKPNHLVEECSMGSLSVDEDTRNSSSIITGDLAIARYLLRASFGVSKMARDLARRGTIEEEAMVDTWVDYAASLRVAKGSSSTECAIKSVHEALSSQRSTYLVGHQMTLADIAVFAAMGFNAEIAIPDDLCVAQRWLNQMGASIPMLEAIQMALSIGSNAGEDANKVLEPLASGMSPLIGGLPGHVCTRFPPEPSGYLHIGHAKAVLLNDYYARRYQGKLIVRFDDTNPSKEKEEFQQSIIEDLATLGVKPDVVTHTSDYFGTIQKYAEYLIHQGLAFMDDTPQEKMQAERLAREESIHRNQPVETAQKLFAKLCKGDKDAATYCLRAKIDMSSVNGTMRDPVIYRQNLIPHHNTGTQFKAYPTYDLACPIVDSIEGVTHALRTTEYDDRDEQYAWIQHALGLRRVRIHAFCRLNFNHTELSKRKLTWFVENGIVTGWDDARFPTVRGITRRGLNVDALRAFMYSQGASRRIVNMEWNKFWAENKKFIDEDAKRFMAIAADPKERCELTITNFGSNDLPQYITADLHPKKPVMGKRVVKIGPVVYLEKLDTQGMSAGENIVLMKWGVVKLTKVELNDEDGSKTVLEGEFIPNGDIKAAKRKITWLVKDEVAAAGGSSSTKCTISEFDNLISKEKLEEGDDFKDFVNPNTMASSEIIADAGVKSLQHNEVIQLERRGYFRVDRPYLSESKPLVLFMIPDGKAKAMGGLTGKLAHR